MRNASAFSSSQPALAWIPILPAAALLERELSRLRAIVHAVGVPRRYWEVFYQPVFDRFAEFVQLLPASQAHHHACVGGLLKHSLEVVEQTLRLREGRLLPPGTAPEHASETQDAWVYAFVTAALLHDVGTAVVDFEVTCFDSRGRPLGRWEPWRGPMAGASFQHRAIPSLHDRSHDATPALLAGQWVPSAALSWLANQHELFTLWLAWLAGRSAEAGLLGQLVSAADRWSIERDVVIRPETQQRTFQTVAQATTPASSPATEEEIQKTSGATARSLAPPKDSGAVVPASQEADAVDSQAPPSSIPDDLGTEEPDVGHEFLGWLAQQIQSNGLAINCDGAPVQRVAEGLLLVSPRIFKLFAREDPQHRSGSEIQSAFKALKLHRAGVTCYCDARNPRSDKVRGFLIAAPERVLGIPLPEPNPALSLSVQVDAG